MTTSSSVSMESMPRPAPMSGAFWSTDSGAMSRPRVSTSLRASSGTRESVASVTIAPTALVDGDRGCVLSCRRCQAMENQTSIGAAEAKRILEHVLLVGQRARLGHHVEVDVGVAREIDGGQNYAALHAFKGQQRFKHACRTHGVTEFRLVGANRRHGVRSEERRVGKEGRSRWSPY